MEVSLIREFLRWLWINLKIKEVISFFSKALSDDEAFFIQKSLILRNEAFSIFYVEKEFISPRQQQL